MKISYRHHYRDLIRLGIPIIVGQIGTIILGFADTMMIGRHSADELSAAGFVVSLFNLIIIAGLGFSYGLTPVVGALFGQGKRHEAGGSLKHSLVANLVAAALMFAIMFALYCCLPLLGQPEELLPIIRPFYWLMLTTIPFTMLFNAFKQFADGVTDTRSPMWVMLAGNVINIVGNWVLIYGKCGLPELGLIGAGTATVIARLFMLGAMVTIVFRTERYRPYVEGFRLTAFNRADFWQLNRLGAPIALQMGMETASFSLVAIMMGWISAAAIASHQILTTVSSTCFMVYYGMGAAVAVKVANYRGVGDYTNARRNAYAGFHLILALGIVIATTVWFFRPAICGCFTDSEEVTAIAVSLIIPMMCYQFGDGLQFCFANALRGIADVKALMSIAFVAYVLLSLPLSYLFAFPMGLGAVGIWMAFPVSLTTAGTLFFLRFRSQTLRYARKTS